ncbi:NAD(P)-binding protein [Testicularia cyperi]|uniref:NAD(P)-binding protein n=1 Tax=Testicularia cyperi TaxID=1882483 RepID=A0A317XL31_9BASI|nr:NAD(P)-binding protein [Testicularia cyperi]
MSAQPKVVNQLKDKKVVVLGGSSGLGFGAASGIIEEGGSVVIASSSEERVSKAVERLSDPAQQYNADKSRISGHVLNLKGSDVESRLKDFFSQVGQFDHLIYTSGDSLAVKGLEEHTYESIVEAANVRLISALLAVKVAVYGGYLREGGSIVLTTGSVVEGPLEKWSVVAGFASSIYGLARSLAFDLSPRNIRVNAISPGPVDTELFDSFGPEAKAATFKHLEGLALTHRVGRITDLAQAYLYVLKDTNITGQTIGSNGGTLFGPGPASQ